MSPLRTLFFSSAKYIRNVVRTSNLGEERLLRTATWTMLLGEFVVIGGSIGHRVYQKGIGSAVESVGEKLKLPDVAEVQEAKSMQRNTYLKVVAIEEKLLCMLGDLKRMSKKKRSNKTAGKKLDRNLTMVSLRRLGVELRSMQERNQILNRNQTNPTRMTLERNRTTANRWRPGSLR